MSGWHQSTKNALKLKTLIQLNKILVKNGHYANIKVYNSHLTQNYFNTGEIMLME